MNVRIVGLAMYTHIVQSLGHAVPVCGNCVRSSGHAAVGCGVVVTVAGEHPTSVDKRTIADTRGNRGVHPGHYRRQAVSGNNVDKPRVTAIVDGWCSAKRGSPPPTRTPTTRSTPCCGPASRGTTSTSIPPAAPRPAGHSSTWPSSCSAPATPSRSPAWTGSAAPCCTW